MTNNRESMTELDTDFNSFIGDFSSEYAEQYAVRRPAYPDELFDWLVELSPATGHAWDAGTGAGELAAPLADRFTKVTASDANADMLREARQRPNLSYHQWPSERPDLPDRSIDLVTAGMASHWFGDEFFEACRRVATPGAILASVSFYFFEAENGIGELIKDWYHRDMTGYEFAQLTVLRNHYRDHRFPFQDRPLGDFTMMASWSYPQLAAFLHQWIVVKRAREVGVDALAELLPRIAERWPGGPETETEIRWPLFGRIATIPA